MVRMIRKIISIKNFGPFLNYNAGQGWDGTLSKNNIIYAPNGSGKTSLSLIFESLRGKEHLVHKKKSLFSNEKPYIHLRDDSKSYKFKKGKWDSAIPQLAVFNSYYLEDNVYVIGNDRAIDSSISTNVLFQEIPDVQSSILNEFKRYDKKIGKVNSQKDKLSKQIIKLQSDKNSENYKERMGALIKESKDLLIKRKQLVEERKLVPNQFRSSQVKETSLKFVDSINKYLNRFTPNIEFVRVEPIYTKEHGFKQANFEIKVNGRIITLSDRSESSLKYFLSEGDKNSVALAIFLAKFDLIPDLHEYIVVIDDPFTSFDSFRKSTTVKEIERLSLKVNQMIVLTHDLHFAKDLSKGLADVKKLEVKVIPNNRSVEETDFDKMLLTGLLKDVKTLHSLSIIDTYSQNELLRIARSIRPSLEGMFRIKFLGELRESEWLGDIICKIRDSDEESRFFRLKEDLEEIEDINDYSKKFHHSRAQYDGENIDFQELTVFVNRTLKILDKI